MTSAKSQNKQTPQEIETQNRYLTTGTYAAIIAMVLDQIHKFYMIQFYFAESKKTVEVFSFYNHVMVWNRGISFGMFQGHEFSNYIFMTTTTLICLLLFWFIKKSTSRLEAAAYGLIIGGACGNLIDRILHGAVADFFDFHLNGKHWPAFNIADSCVFVGAAILIVSTVFFSRKKDEK